MLFLATATSASCLLLYYNLFCTTVTGTHYIKIFLCSLSLCPPIQKSISLIPLFESCIFKQVSWLRLEACGVHWCYISGQNDDQSDMIMSYVMLSVMWIWVDVGMRCLCDVCCDVWVVICDVGRWVIGCAVQCRWCTTKVYSGAKENTHNKLTHNTTHTRTQTFII